MYEWLGFCYIQATSSCIVSGNLKIVSLMWWGSYLYPSLTCRHINVGSGKLQWEYYFTDWCPIFAWGTVLPHSYAWSLLPIAAVKEDPFFLLAGLGYFSHFCFVFCIRSAALEATVAEEWVFRTQTLRPLPYLCLQLTQNIHHCWEAAVKPPFSDCSFIWKSNNNSQLSY